MACDVNLQAVTKRLRRSTQIEDTIMSLRSNSLPLRSALLSVSALFALATTACADSEEPADDASAAALSGDDELDENGNAALASLVGRDGYLEIIRTGGVTFAPARDYCTLLPCSADREFEFVARDRNGKRVSGFHAGDWVTIVITPAVSKLLAHGYSLGGGVELEYSLKGNGAVARDSRALQFRGGYYVGASFTVPSGVDALHPTLRAQQVGRPWMPPGGVGSNDPGCPKASRAQGGSPIPISATSVKTDGNRQPATIEQEM